MPPRRRPASSPTTLAPAPPARAAGDAAPRSWPPPRAARARAGAPRRARHSLGAAAARRRGRVTPDGRPPRCRRRAGSRRAASRRRRAATDRSGRHRAGRPARLPRVPRPGRPPQLPPLPPASRPPPPARARRARAAEGLAPDGVAGQFGAPRRAQRIGQRGVPRLDLVVVGVGVGQPRQRLEQLAPHVQGGRVGRQQRGVVLDRPQLGQPLGVGLRHRRQVPRPRVAEARLGQVTLAHQPAVAVHQAGQVERQRLAHRLGGGDGPQRRRGPVPPAPRRAAPADAAPPLEPLAAALVVLRVGRSDVLGAQLVPELARPVAGEVADRAAPGRHVGARAVEHRGVGVPQRGDGLLHAGAPALQLTAAGVERRQRREVAIELAQLASHPRHVRPERGPRARPQPRPPRGPRHRAHAVHQRPQRRPQDGAGAPTEHQLQPEAQEQDGGHEGEHPGRAGEGPAQRHAPGAGIGRREQHQERPGAGGADQVTEQHPRPARRAAAKQEERPEEQEGPGPRPGAPADRVGQVRAQPHAHLARGEARQQHEQQRGTEGQQHEADRLEVERAGGWPWPSARGSTAAALAVVAGCPLGHGFESTRPSGRPL
jgi:hypothetical protein